MINSLCEELADSIFDGCEYRVVGMTAEEVKALLEAHVEEAHDGISDDDIAKVKDRIEKKFE